MLPIMQHSCSKATARGPMAFKCCIFCNKLPLEAIGEVLMLHFLQHYTC
ncbi:hypothetical protein SAMN05518855_1008211 [Paenibacillus sp. CF384]|nr:hypothetical protein SAMN05518855_1008211 [Paenibacillus sp. CF384]